MNTRSSHPDALQRKAAPRLRHEYVAGLRFDREPCHAVHTARGLRWAKLAWPDGDVDAETGNACAIRYAVGLLTQSKVSESQTAAARPRAIVHRDAPLKTLAALAHEALLRGDVCLLEVWVDSSPSREGERRPASRLMTIVGVEVEDGPELRVRALLLLDPVDAQPWACGHNARLPITAASEIVTVHQATGHLLRCRIGAVIEWTDPSRP